MKKRNSFLVILFFIFTTQVSADSLSVVDFLKIVKEKHPFAKSADLTSKLGLFEVLQARGFFDPTINFQNESKKFSGTDYYNKNLGELKIPTWYGLDFKAGLQNNSGTYLDGENYIKDYKQSYLGLQLNVFNVILGDERRNIIRQAKVNANIQNQEGRKILNSLQYEAGKLYSDWYFIHQLNLIRKEAEFLAKERLDATASRAKIGDIATIDSIDAYSEWQKRVLETKQSILQNDILRLNLSLFLWKNDSEQVLLNSNINPSASILDTRIQKPFSNIEIEKSRLKIQSLQLDRKLARRNLLPELNLGYNLLSKNYGFIPEDQAGPFLNNYKSFFDFYYPLFLRKARGKLNLIQTKQSIQEIELFNSLKVLDFDLERNTKEYLFLLDVITLQKSNIANFQQLTNAEKRRFQFGESTVFLVNQRELKLIEAKIKLIELESKLIKNSIENYYLRGAFAN